MGSLSNNFIELMWRTAQGTHGHSVKLYPTLNTTTYLIKPEIAITTKGTPKYLYQVVPRVLPTQH